MQSIVPDNSLNSRASYLFVDNMRFVSMAGIVMMHSVGSASFLLHTIPGDGFDIALIQIFKSSTIIFFLVSGFLAGERVTRSGPVAYLKRRLRVIVIPWLFWCVLTCTAFLSNAVLIKHHKFATPISIASFVWKFIFGTAFWFVPNLICSMAILFLLRHFFSERVLRICLVLLSLFYGINIYYQWIPSSHMEAFGFIFYLWLGEWTARNYRSVVQQINRIPTQLLFCTTIFSLLIAIQESQVLHTNGFTDSLNSLRISNQVFSLTVFALLFKCKYRLAPSSMNVRSLHYGIYLTHTLVLAMVCGIAKGTLGSLLLKSSLQSPQGRLLVVGCIFFTTYSLVTLITICLFKFPSLSWMAGSGRLKDQKQKAAVVNLPENPAVAMPSIL